VAKVLNIDAIAAPNRILTLSGKEYPIDDLTVENFIATTKEAERLKDEKNQGVQMEATVSMIMRSIPSIERNTLTALSLDKLLIIVRFVQGELDESPSVKVTPEGEEKK
jgi:hypothetical protein